MTPLDQIGQITKVLKTTSAAVPALIFGLVAGALCITAAMFGPEELSQIFTIAGLAFLSLPALQIAFFTFSDPDRLQNEEHVEKKLLIAQSKPFLGDKGSIVDIDTMGAVINNPALEDRSDV